MAIAEDLKVHFQKIGESFIFGQFQFILICEPKDGQKQEFNGEVFPAETLETAAANAAASLTQLEVMHSSTCSNPTHYLLHQVERL